MRTILGTVGAEQAPRSPARDSTSTAHDALLTKIDSPDREAPPSPGQSVAALPTLPTLHEEASASDAEVDSPGRGGAVASLACISVDEHGFIALRAHKTSLIAGIFPAIGLLAYGGSAAAYGMEHHNTAMAGEVFLLAVGLFASVLATAQMACGGSSSGGGGAGGEEREKYSESVRLAGCAIGITVSFLFYGYVLEGITSRQGSHFPEVVGILLNSVTYVGVSRLAIWLQGQVPARVHARQFMAIAASSKLATFLTWRALRYVNFPTQVLAKSCKALPIMAVNRLAGKRHSWMQYTQVSLITAGVVMFMMYREGMDDKQAQANTWTGAVMLLFALAFDGLTGHLEDSVIKEMEWKHGQGTFDLMLFINVYSIPFCLVYIVANNEVGTLLSLSLSEITAMVWLSLAGALGQMCIFYTIANFGALTCSLITTLRKMLQIGLSALAFGHRYER